MKTIIDYSRVTEVPGDRASSEQIQRLFSRYHFAIPYCDGKDVLEVACGAGQGLGYLAQRAKKVVGGDFTESLVVDARSTYKGNMPVLRLDAHILPFHNDCFDVVILYEAIYYLIQPEAFLGECCRVLRDGGKVIICSVNREWDDFNPSPHSVRYFSASELYNLMVDKFDAVELFGGFETCVEAFKDRMISLLKRTAVSFNLMPKTMKGKEFLKRIFFGSLEPMPGEIRDGMCEYVSPEPVSPDKPVKDYKVIYAVARKR
jgi:SAM-dependent methyltransferase